MAAAVSVSPAEASVYNVVTVSGSGFAINTDHVVQVTQPDGGSDPTTVTTDGSGAFTMPYTPNGTGSYTITVTPVDTSVATATLTVVD